MLYWVVVRICWLAQAFNSMASPMVNRIDARPGVTLTGATTGDEKLDCPLIAFISVSFHPKRLNKFVPMTQLVTRGLFLIFLKKWSVRWRTKGASFRGHFLALWTH